MLRAGALLPPPDSIQETKMDIEYVGPLARSQRMEEANAIDRLYQLAMNIAQINPAVMEIINHDEAVRMRAKLLGVPNSILVSRDDVADAREAQAQQMLMQQQMMQEQQAAQVTQQQAEAAKAVADPDAQKGIQQAQEQLQGL